MNNLSKTVSLRIGQLLNEKSITQYKFAQMAGLSQDTLKSIMKGKAKGVNLRTIAFISKGFEMTMSQFLNDDIFKFEKLDLD